MKLFKYLLNLIYPGQRHCLNCNQLLFKEELRGICINCLDKISFIDKYCEICGCQVEDKVVNVLEYNGFSKVFVCKDCRKDKSFNFDKARSISVYDGIMRDIIIEFKYEGKKEYAETLGKLLYIYYIKYYNRIKIDYLLPVPLHRKRKAERKFNQAQLMTAELSNLINVPVLNNYMIRIRNNPPLYNLDFSQREKIMNNIFILDNYINIDGKTILIIDDIFTSGSTVNQVAKVLKNQGGAGNVLVLTLASTNKIQL